MEVINDNKLVIIKEPKAINFDITKNIEKNVNYEINFVIKHNEFLAVQAIKR